MPVHLRVNFGAQLFALSVGDCAAYCHETLSQQTVWPEKHAERGADDWMKACIYDCNNLIPTCHAAPWVLCSATVCCYTDFAGITFCRASVSPPAALNNVPYSSHYTPAASHHVTPSTTGTASRTHVSAAAWPSAAGFASQQRTPGTAGSNSASILPSSAPLKV